jgi:hypothetical protein
MGEADQRQNGVSEAMASVLRSGRSEFNSQFAEARRLYPALDGGAFLEFLRNDVDQLVRAVEKAKPEFVAEVVMAAYECGLELIGQKLVGPGARNRIVEEGWRRVLPGIAALVAKAPARVIGAFSNGLHNLAGIAGARPEQWISEMEKLGPRCADVEALLRLGQVEAWRAGLAHFRQGAIAAADNLPAPLALAAVGAPANGDWPEIRKRLLADPWYNPSASVPKANGESGRVPVVTEAGAFRGYGGVFVEPPRVASAGEHFLVRSGEERWLLTADVFGATFHRSSPAEFESAEKQTKLPKNLHVSDSKLSWKDVRFEIAGLGKFTSFAANETTLALTSELTHSVILVAVR